MRDAYSYQAVLATSERVSFRLDEVLPSESTLDFGRPFLPEALTRSAQHAGLTPRERLLFNQVFAHTYLSMFGLVEEFILPFVLDHARSGLDKEDGSVRAFLTFANEEAKHIELFKRFRATFERGFATHCDVVGPAVEITKAVLAHEPLAVALAILHIEWMTQRHYVESVRSDAAIEPHIADLLKQHWLEEAQHAKLDTLLAESIARGLSKAEIDRGVTGYLSIVDALDGLLRVQSELDVAALERARGARFTEAESAQLAADHLEALRATFLVSGMSHPSFLSTVAELSPPCATRVQKRVRTLIAS